MAMWNVLMDVNIRYLIIKIVLAVVAMLLMTLVGAFMSDYIDSPNKEGMSRTMCYVCFFSPPFQLFYGMIFIIYRYPLFVLNN